MIYKLQRENPEDMVTKFFLPDDSLSMYFNRLAELSQMRENGYLVMGIAYVDKQTYLNERLNETVREYLYMDNSEEDTKWKYRCGEMTREVALKTLEMINDRKWTLLKVMASQIRRLMREDFDVDNEIAIQLYDQYCKALL